MPSNRAILRDIADLELDPSVAYAKTSTNGRLGRRSIDMTESVEPVVHETKHVKEPTKEIKVVKPVIEPLPKPIVTVEKVVNDGVVDEKIEVTVGDLKLEVEVPVSSGSTEVASSDAENADVSTEKSDEELPEIPAGEDVLVLASSKKIKAKKAAKPAV